MLKVIVTHDGIFHADEVVAIALLMQFGPQVDETIIRTRDPKIVESADVVIDVGGVFDPSKGRFDHHQNKNSQFASAGLVWNWLKGEREIPNRVIRVIDALVAEVDKIDLNGGNHAGSISMVVSSFNGDAEGFNQALEFTKNYIKRLVNHEMLALKQEVQVLAAVKNAINGVVILDKFLPWGGVLMPPGITHVVFPSPSPGQFNVQCVPVTPGERKLRVAFPESVRAASPTVIADETGVQDAVFCHANGFIAGAKTIEGAVKLALWAQEVSGVVA